MEILLLCLEAQSFFDDSYASLLNHLSNSSQLKRARSAKGAIRYIEANNPNVIIVTDQGLALPENKPVLDKILAYLQTGGLVIVGLHFPNFVNMDEFDSFFNEFGLPWKSGDYRRTEFQFNPSSTLPANTRSASMPDPYSMKVLHVKDARSHEKIFIPVAGAQTQSLVFPPEYVDHTQAAVVGAKIGEGYLVYHGDVNQENESDQVLLALCGI